MRPRTAMKAKRIWIMSFEVEWIDKRVIYSDVVPDIVVWADEGFLSEVSAVIGSSRLVFMEARKLKH